MDERFLVRRAQAGDGNASAKLMAALAPMIRGIAAPYYLQGGDRADLHQEGRIGAWQAIRDFRADRNASFRAFAALCIRRQVITAVKTATRGKHQVLNHAVSLARPIEGDGDEDRTLEDTLGREDDPSDRIAAVQNLRDLVDSIYVELSPLERESLLGISVEGRSYREVAAYCEVGTKVVDNAHQRARRKLRDAV